MDNSAAWAANNPETRKVSALVPNARNARTHSDEQVMQLADSIREWGWTIPVLIDEGDGIIAGHGRVLAAQAIGLDEVPVLVARGWSDEQKRAYVLADNKLALNAGWDMAMVKEELAALEQWGFDTSLIGFSDDDFAEASEKAARELSLGSLSEKFGVPPFSVLNAREGAWQERKRAWLGLGIQSELGRGENLLAFSDSVALDGKAYNERFKAKKKGKTLGAIPPNEQSILKRRGKYAAKKS